SQPTHVEVLTAVFQVRDCAERGHALHVLLTRPTEDGGPFRLPGGPVGERDTLETSARRHLGEQAGLTRAAHLEQLSVFSDPDRVPGTRTIASTFLGLVPRDIPAEPATGSAAWRDVTRLDPLAYDHAQIIAQAR